MKKTLSIVTLLLIILTGAMLSGCSQDYGSLSLSLKNADKIEMLTTDQKVDYTIVINNYFDFNAEFDFYFAEQKAAYVDKSIENLGGGEYKFSIAPISEGNTTLTITLRGIGNHISVPVVVAKEIESVSAKQNIYIKKGGSLKIDSSMFTFTPENATLTGLTFELDENSQGITGVTFNKETNVLMVENGCTADTITIKATSMHNSNITTNLVVKIADEIDLGGLNISYANQSTDNVDSFGNDFTPLIEAGEGKNQPVELVLTKDSGYKKKLKVDFLFGDKYSIKISASKNITLDGVDVCTNPIIINKNSEFILSASDVTLTDSELKFEVYQNDFEENKVDVTIEVSAICEPNNITVNNQANLTEIELYTTGNATSKSLKFGIMPQKAVVENYSYKLEFWKKPETGSTTQDPTSVNYSEIKKSFTVKLGGLEPDDNNTVFDLGELKNAITISAISATTNYYIKVVCYKGDKTADLSTHEKICSREININVFAGATSFYVNTSFTNGIIYLPLEEETKEYTFNGLVCQNESKDAVPGKMSIYSSSKQNICTIEQTSSLSTQITITPKSVGEQTFEFTTANGLQTTLKVIIFREINESGLKLDFADQVNNNVSDFGYDDGGNLNTITIKGIGSKVNLAVKPTTTFKDYNQNSFTYSYSLENYDNFEVSENGTITTKNFTEENTTKTLTVAITLNKISRDHNGTLLFQLKEPEIENITVRLKCINYIKSASLYASSKNEQVDQNDLLKKASIYNKRDLSYKNVNLASTYLYLNVNMSSEGTTNHPINLADIEFVYDNETFTIKQDGSVKNNNGTSIGTLTFNSLNNEVATINDKGYIGKFEFNYLGLSNADSINISVEIKDSNTNETFKSDVTLVVEKYINVESIWLSSPEEYIYLDAVNAEKTINVQVYPENANFKEVFVYIDTKDSNCLIAEIAETDNNKITFKFNSAGSGKVLIFPISVMKTNSPTDSNGNYYYHLELNFVCADGLSEQTALKISSLQDLKTLSPDKHYYVDTEIDCKNELVNLGILTGSIRGTFLYSDHKDFKNINQYGRITNFKVNKGLFQTIENDAKVYNLSISGLFSSEYNVNSETNIGLLCGTNNGTISNVFVELNEQNTVVVNTQNDSINVNFGLVAGTNIGTIQIDDNCKNYTLMVCNTKTTTLSVEFSGSQTSNFGGIVGYNTGTIQNTLSQDLITIGLYGIHASIFALSNATNFGGIVGSNVGGTISGLKVTGEIDGRIIKTNTDNTKKTLSATNVAGFVATSSGGEIKNNTSRIFVRGSGTILSGFVAASSGTTYSNNKIQAVDNGERTGINASFIVYYGAYDSNKVLVTAPSSIAAGITAETYFKRNIHSGLSAANSNTSIEYDYSGDDGNSKDYYYGDVVFADSTNIYYYSKFTEGSEDSLPNNIKMVIAAYMQASNSVDQQKISNLTDTISLLKYLNITCRDIDLEIKNPSVARLEYYGKNICILGVGALNIKISSALNYTNQTTAELNITNYYDTITAYKNKEKTESMSKITLVNNQTTFVYFKAASSFYNYKNTPITLAQNNEISFEVNGNITDLLISVQGTTAFVTRKAEITTDEISFYTIFKLDGYTYYCETKKTDNSEDMVVGDNNKKLLVFAKQKTINSSYTYELNGYTVEATMGIENVKTNKSHLSAEPTDTIEFFLTYNTFDDSDFFSAQLGVGEETKDSNGNTIIDYQYFNLKNNSQKIGIKGSGTFETEEEKTLFTLKWGDVIDLQNLTKRIDFSLRMLGEGSFDTETYNYLVGKTIKLVLTSHKTNQSITVYITITPETISSVLINNFDSSNNTEMITSSNGVNTFDLKEMLYSGNQASTAELNTINAYVNTKYSQFDYVDVTMQLQAEGGYLGYIQYDSANKKGTVSSDSVYTSITGGSTIRIFKNSIKEIDDSLLIGLVYKIPKTVADGTIIPITFSFYNKNVSEPVWVETTNLISKLTNQVSFEIYNKKVVEELADYKTYNVAEGMTYLLDTTIVGYTSDEAVFESDNPGIANVVYAGGSYYLKISNNINYESNAYKEVIITSYGKKDSSESIKKTTKLHIYKFLVADNMFGENNTINLRLLESTNVLNVIADKIQFECANINTPSQNQFLESFKTNAQLFLIDKNTNEIQITNTTNLSYDEFILNRQTITTKLVQSPCNFSFVIKYKLDAIEGVPTISEPAETDILTSYQFEVNSYLSTTSDNATPIYNYNDMLEMKDDEYYRQVADITISPSQLQMLTVSPKMFDGNGYKIKISSGTINFALDSSSDFALFKTNKTGNIIKNVTIEILGNLNIVLDNNTSSNGANIALLVAENNGIITNCAIKSTNVVTVDILSTIVVMENSFFAGLCANNYGDITNCQVECNLTASGASLAGVVANNVGHVASSYIKNSRIHNTTSTTNENITTAGFVCRNTGSIAMCYVEGLMNSASKRIYADYAASDSKASKIIYTATKVAGFVYENSGDIMDCYSNIPIMSTNESSGFVAKATSGTITRVFSLSKLKQQDTLNYGFVASHEQTEENVIFKDCFFLIEDNLINYNTSQTNYTYSETDNKIVSVIDGIEPLSIADFNVCDSTGQFKQDSKLKSFVTNNKKSQGVWFYVFDSTKEASTSFNMFTYSTKVDGENALNGEYIARRLHLVSPNIIAFSQLDINFDKNNPDKYIYTTSSSSQTPGSETNPYLISSVNEFETYCNQLNGEYSYYRQICSINYIEEQKYSSNLYNKSLIGYYEGNGFSISGYSVNTITSNLSAGLFASIGSQESQISCLKNTIFEPYYINLPNSIYVGAIAGTAINASVANVSVLGEDVVVIGKNIVGGLFGRTTDETFLSLIYSNISVKASHYNSTALTTNKTNVEGLLRLIQFSEINSNGGQVSYSGSLVGYVGGVANITQASVGENAKTFAMISGLMFGGIGGIAKVSNFNLNLNSFDNSVEAYAFAGYVAGEIKGEVNNFSINSKIINYNAFTCYPITPVSIGGVAGYAKGAKIDGLNSLDGYSVVGAHILGVQEDQHLKVHNPYIARYVGGIVGYAEGVKVGNVSIGNTVYKEQGKIDYNKSTGLALMGSYYVGGIFGCTKETNTITETTKINFVGEKTYINAEEVSETNKLYFSYVSESVGENIPTYSFENIQQIGLVAGNEKTFKNNVVGFTLETDVKIELTLLSDLEVFFETYKGVNTNESGINREIVLWQDKICMTESDLKILLTKKVVTNSDTVIPEQITPITITQ